MSEGISPVAKPDVAYIDELLDQIERGELRVPRFQRPFVWNPHQMTKLFDSIQNGYPIGSLLLWRTGERVESLDKIGPISIPHAEKKPTSYVLDGHQRLSTLFGVLRLPKDLPRDQGDNWKWWIYYDLREKQFIQNRHGFSKPHHLPMRAILRTMDFLGECRRIQKELPAYADAMIEEAERLAQTFKTYRLPINVVLGGLKQAVETFSRLNTTGQAMSTDQMLSALTYREGAGKFHLESRINQILKQLEDFNFGGLNRITIFRTIVAATENDVYRTDWSSVYRSLDDQLPAVVDECEQSILRAVQFLVNELGVVSSRILPYEPQLMLLSEFFRLTQQVTSQQVNLLRKWFWVTSFSGWFAGASNSQINNALLEFRELARYGRTDFDTISLTDPARPFPSQFNMRSARVRAFVLFLLSREPRSLTDGSRLSVDKLIEQEGFKAFVYISDEGSSSPGNRLLLGFLNRKAVINRLLMLKDGIRDEVLASHFIPEDAYEYLANGNAQGFIQARNAHLRECEREFMREKGVVITNKVEPEDPELDIDIENE